MKVVTTGNDSRQKCDLLHTLLGPRQYLSSILMLGIALTIIVIMTMSFFWTWEREKRHLTADFLARARLVTTQFLSIRNFMAVGQGSFFTRHVDAFSAQEGIDRALQDRSWRIKEVWLDCTRQENCPDRFEAEVLEIFLRETDRPELFRIERQGEHTFFRYAVPIRVEPACLHCHGGQNGDGKAWSPPVFQVGELRGAVTLQVPTDFFSAALRTAIGQQLAFTAALLFLALGTIYFLTCHFITTPLRRITQLAGAVAGGNLKIADTNLVAYGEMGLLWREFQTMTRRLEDSYQGLEELVKERTAELNRQKEELRRANEELARNYHLKSTFLTTMSHELRTPLTAIIAPAELLLDGIGGALTEKQRGYLLAIRENGWQLLKLINDILDLAKLESGRLELKISTFDLGEAVATTAERLRPLAARKEITLLAFSEPGLPPALGDREKIEQVLSNLLSNAIKFTPNGGRVEVKAGLNPAGREFLVSVSDNGIGIRPEDQEVIFEAFRQLQTSTTREFRGTGLGLSLARGLLAKHGGRIWVQSKFGEGSTFFFTLPLGSPPGTPDRHQGGE